MENDAFLDATIKNGRGTTEAALRIEVARVGVQGVAGQSGPAVQTVGWRADGADQEFSKGTDTAVS
jgi:hypothetical protein